MIPLKRIKYPKTSTYLSKILKCLFLQSRWWNVALIVESAISEKKKLKFFCATQFLWLRT